MPDSRSRKYGVRKRGKKWVARPYVAGEHHWVGTFATEDEALREAIKVYDKLVRLPANRETVKTFQARWLTDYPRPKESTNALYKQMTAMFAEDFGSKRLRDVSRLDARRFARDHKGAARSVRTMFSDAMDEGLVEVNPFYGLKAINSGGAQGRKDLVVLSLSELDKLIGIARAAHEDYDFWQLVAFAAYTGMRPSEVYGLEWGDINYKASEVHVQRQIHRGLVTTPKNGKDRRIILPPAAEKALKSLDKYEPLKMLDLTGKTRDFDLVFRNKSGDAMSQSSQHYYWHPVRVAFGRPKMEMYELRHFCATYLLEMFRAAGEDGAYDVATQLGHTDEGELVRNLYGHPDDDLSRERLKRLFEKNVEPLRGVEDSEEETG